MRRAFDFLGLTRAKGSPRPKLLTAFIGGIGLFLILFGGAMIGGNVEAGQPAAIWIGTALIVVGLVCWVIEAVLASRAKGDEPSR